VVKVPVLKNPFVGMHVKFYKNKILLTHFRELKYSFFFFILLEIAKLKPHEIRLARQNREIKGAFFWDYSGYSYSSLGITEYMEFQFRKERSL